MSRMILIFLLLSLFPFTAHAVDEGWKESAVEVIPHVLEEYGDLIASASAEFQISALFGFGILITESLGDKDAVSTSNAIGLMQMKEETATFVRSSFPEKYFGDDLTDPTTSIRLAYGYLYLILHKYEYESMYEATLAYYLGHNGAKGVSFGDAYDHPYVAKVRFVMAQENVPVLIGS